MNIISNVKLGNILDELSAQFHEHKFKSVALKEMTEEDKRNVEVLISYDNKLMQHSFKNAPIKVDCMVCCRCKQVTATNDS